MENYFEIEYIIIYFQSSNLNQKSLLDNLSFFLVCFLRIIFVFSRFEFLDYCTKVLQLLSQGILGNLSEIWGIIYCVVLYVCNYNYLRLGFRKKWTLQMNEHGQDFHLLWSGKIHLKISKEFSISILQIESNL